jgi:ligand-binding SRPBCC domain-containing protein
MKLNLRTTVNQSFRQVFRLFTKELFLKLSPPFPKVKLLRFDGSEKQDRVVVELDFIFFKQKWESVIVEKKESKDEIFFVDEGVKLPFFLKKWRHTHRIIRNGDKADIVDDIEFETPFRLFDFLFYPILYFQFAYRKPIYKKVFSETSS